MALDKQFRRALFGAIPVTIGLACAGGPDPERDDPSTEGSSELPTVSAETTERVEQLGDRFRLGGTDGPAVLGAGAVADYLPIAGGFDVRLRASTALGVTLPASASGAVEVRGRGGVAARFVLEGASSEVPAFGEGVAVYAGAAPGGGDLVHRVTARAVEDFVVFDEEPEGSRVSYSLDVSRAAGLRQVGSVLELLDADGTPRLRMKAPYLVDDAGRRHAAAVTVEGCTVDTRGIAPWGREVIPPGNDLCTVQVSWDSSTLTYPALLDPAWTDTTGAMAQNRAKHTATKLATGEVLIVGGERPATGTEYLSSIELYDPTSETFAEITFSATPTGRSEHVAVLRGDGSVVVAGGTNGTALASTEILTDITGVTPTLTTGDDLTTARSGAKAVLLNSGDVLIVGGVSGSSVLASTEVLSGGTWGAGGTMPSARRGHVLVKLGSGPPMVIAGITTTSVSDLNQVEFYDANTDTWQPTDPLNARRYFHAGAVLTDGRVLVAGGYQRGVSNNIASSEILDPSGTGLWSNAGTAGTPRQYHTVTALANGSAVLVGGAETTDGVAIQAGTYKADSYLFDPDTDTWDSGPTLSTARAHHTATLLDDGTVLVTGGQTPLGVVTDTAELLGLDADGTACSAGNSCQSGYCVDGVCCDAACDGLCESCAGTSTGGSDGVCAPVAAGTDPDSECTDDGASVCAKNGFCSGIQGACQTYGTSPCTPNACTTGLDCTSGWCVDGICCDESCSGTCEACTAALKGAGSDGVCGPIAEGTDPEDECAAVGTGDCAGEGACDGVGSCEASTTGNVCAALGCIDVRTLGYESTCDELGECAPQTTVDCGLYACDDTNLECRSSCVDNTDCAPGVSCQGGSCLPNPNGTTCVGGAECQSGYCIDGVCCEESCSGNCEACDVPGSVGMCIPVTGQPRGSRAACTGTGTCGGRCDGINPNTCTFPDEQTECGSGQRCENDSEYREVCQGNGQCAEELVTVCDPYRCGADACLTECGSDDDCRSGYRCDGNGECVDAGRPFCADPQTAQTADGETESCLQYACSQGVCLDSCVSDEQCAENATCYVQQGVCAFPSSDGGCGCRVASPRSPERLPAALSLLGLGLFVSRRRRPAA